MAQILPAGNSPFLLDIDHMMPRSGSRWCCSCCRSCWSCWSCWCCIMIINKKNNFNLNKSIKLNYNNKIWGNVYKLWRKEIWQWYYISIVSYICMYIYANIFCHLSYTYLQRFFFTFAFFLFFFLLLSLLYSYKTLPIMHSNHSQKTHSLKRFFFIIIWYF